MNIDLQGALAIAAICIVTLLVWLPIAVRRDIRRDAQRVETMRRHPAGKHAPDAEFSTFTHRNRR